MSKNERIKATDPSWYWVVVENRDEAARYRELGHLIVVQKGALVRTSVPIDDDLPPTGDPHADKRWQ